MSLHSTPKHEQLHVCLHSLLLVPGLAQSNWGLYARARGLSKHSRILWELAPSLF
eukprot:jgi/Botrbrau1/20900/Bobra.0135s0031.1